MLTKASRLIQIAWSDCLVSFRIWRYWFHRAFVMYRLQYEGSKLNLLWPILAHCIVIFILNLVWGVVLGRKGKGGEEYFVYLLTGFPVWRFLSGAIRSGANGFQNIPAGLPLSAILLEKLCFNSFFLMNIAPVLLLVPPFLTGVGGVHLFYLPLAIMTLILWAFGVVALLSVLSEILPDFKHIVAIIMRFAFLATPIIWEPTRFGSHQEYLLLNPFFAPLELGRYSFSGIISNPDVLWIAPLYALITACLGFIVFARYINIAKLKIA